MKKQKTTIGMIWNNKTCEWNYYILNKPLNKEDTEDFEYFIVSQRLLKSDVERLNIEVSK